MSDRTPGSYYIAERTLWHGEVTMIRTSFDKSAVIGVTNRHDAPLFAAAPDLLEACYKLLMVSEEVTAGRYSEDVKNWASEIACNARKAITKAGGDIR